jgi:hypothetical protein
MVPLFYMSRQGEYSLIITKHVSVYESIKKITFAAQVTFKNIGQSDTIEAYCKLCTINCIEYDFFFSRNIEFHNKKKSPKCSISSFGKNISCS